MMLLITYCILNCVRLQLCGQFLIYFLSMSSEINEVIRSNRRTIAIVIDSRGKVVIRAPHKVPMSVITAFITTKQSWIDQKIAEAKQRTSKPETKFSDGELFYLFGEKRQLKVTVQAKSALAYLNGEFVLHPARSEKALLLFEKLYKKIAKDYLTERANSLAVKYGYKFGKVSITSARTRWGSCSTTGTISFTWRLIMAPVEVIDYVVVHELAHISIKDHSKRFWNKVESLMPDYKKHKLWLKQHGSELSLEGAQ